MNMLELWEMLEVSVNTIPIVQTIKTIIIG